MERRVEEDSGVDSGRLAKLALHLARLPVDRRWWPYHHPFVIAVSAVLTQQTRWEAAAAGVERLRERGLLGPRALAAAPAAEVEEALRPTGFYRQKARAIQGIAGRLVEAYDADITRALQGPAASARAEVLSWPGVGPETADAILLFAGKRPVFVVDAYTRRLMNRYGALRPGANPSYDQIQQAWHTAVGRRPVHLARLHAAIVELSKGPCGRVAECSGCPLRAECQQVGVGGAATQEPRPPGATRRRRN